MSRKEREQKQRSFRFILENAENKVYSETKDGNETKTF